MLYAFDFTEILGNGPEHTYLYAIEAKDIPTALALLKAWLCATYQAVSDAPLSAWTHYDAGITVNDEPIIYVAIEHLRPTTNTEFARDLIQAHQVFATPMFFHDCEFCRFLGPYIGPDKAYYDLYYCHQPNKEPYVLARYAPDKVFQSSDLNTPIPSLREAINRARKLDLTLLDKATAKAIRILQTAITSLRGYRTEKVPADEYATAFRIVVQAIEEVKAPQ